jgi:hypothetical protein
VEGWLGFANCTTLGRAPGPATGETAVQSEDTSHQGPWGRVIWGMGTAVKFCLQFEDHAPSLGPNYREACVGVWSPKNKTFFEGPASSKLSRGISLICTHDRSVGALVRGPSYRFSRSTTEVRRSKCHHSNQFEGLLLQHCPPVNIEQ